MSSLAAVKMNRLKWYAVAVFAMLVLMMILNSWSLVSLVYLLKKLTLNEKKVEFDNSIIVW